MLKVEGKGPGPLQRQVELRRAGGEIGHIAGRGNHEHEAGVLVRIQLEGAVRRGGGETVAVRDDDAP